MEADFKSCFQEFQLNIINQTKAQISEAKAEIKATLRGLFVKEEMEEKPTEPVEMTEELSSSKRERLFFLESKCSKRRKGGGGMRDKTY